MKTHRLYPKYRPDIDGLRAVAVLSVVGFHAFPSLVKGGFIGVDLFFVISGYLITMIIFEGLERGTFSFTEFYARRIKRIFPALLLVLVACLFVGWFTLLADEYRQLSKHIVAGISFFSNIVLLNEAGYFDNAADTKPLLHLWSLGIEEQFYIIWPLLVWIAWVRKFNLLTIIFVVGLVSFILNINGMQHDAITTFYSPLTRFWELLMGSASAYLIFYKYISPENFSHFKSNMLSILGFFLITTSIFFITNRYNFPGWLAIPPVLGASLIILAGNKSFINSQILASKFAVWFGLISFPLYLWHWPLLSFARLIEGVTSDRIIRIILIFISIFFAWLTYRFFETYIRSIKNNGSVSILLLSGFFTATFGWYVYINDGLNQRAAVVNSEFTEQVRRQLVGPLWKYTKNDICLNEYSFKDADKIAWWFCMKSDNFKPTLIILGNSYANQLYPGFINNQALKHHSILSIGTCDLGKKEFDEKDDKHPCFGRRYTEQVQFIDNIIDNNKSIKLAIISGLSKNPNITYIEQLKKRITNFESKGVKVIIFTPHIEIGFNPKVCFATPLRWNTKDCTFSLSHRVRIYDDFKPLIDSLKKTNPKVSVFEQNDIFCQGAECSFVKNGIPLHRDAGHISEYASVELQLYFTEWAKIHTPQIFDIDLANR